MKLIPPLDLEPLIPLLRQALAEDIGAGDLTTNALIAPEQTVSARIVCRAPGVVAGVPLVREVFRLLDPELEFRVESGDGAAAEPGLVIAGMTGRARTLLTAERTALNVIQRLSGIATLTARYVRAVEGTNARIYDTRKTTPGWRMPEKYAVRVGGGENHRIGLYDQVLIKDNHIAFRRDLTLPQVVGRCRDASPPGTLVEIEVDTLEQLRAVLPAGADIILLDNMSVQTVAEAVSIVGEASGARRPALEASGGITLENVREYGRAGVDRISIGAITHSAPALDIALDL